MPIDTLRSNVTSAEQAYALLELIHFECVRRLRRWQYGALTGLVAGLALPGPIGKVALSLAAAAAMRWMILLVEAGGRFWFLHQLALRDLMTNPQVVDWDFLSSLLAKVPTEAVHSASPDAPPDGGPTKH